VIVGGNLYIHEDDVYNPGYISSSSEMQNLFLNTNLVVSPARCEPLGLFLIEAMNYGVPCIVTDQDGMPDIIKHGYNGLVVSRRDPNYLSSQIVELLSKPATLKQMAMNAKSLVKFQFNWSIISKKISKTLARVKNNFE